MLLLLDQNTGEDFEMQIKIREAAKSEGVVIMGDF